MCASTLMLRVPSSPGGRMWLCAAAGRATNSATTAAASDGYRTGFLIIRLRQSWMDRHRSARHHTEEHLHPGLQVLRDVAVEHPVARVRHLDEQVHGRAQRNDRRILPHEVRVAYTIPLEHEETLAVQVDRVVHRMQRRRLVVQPDLHDIADGER